MTPQQANFERLRVLVVKHGTKEDVDALYDIREAYNTLQDFVVSCGAYDDVHANARLAKTGRYIGFDEPGSVQGARELLAKIGGA